jgi:hypothetical protein
VDGFAVDPRELDRAAVTATRRRDEIVEHPATRWELGALAVGDDDLAKALAAFQEASRQALEVLSQDWTELADRYRKSAATYRGAETALAAGLDDLARELGT